MRILFVFYQSVLQIQTGTLLEKLKIILCCRSSGWNLSFTFQSDWKELPLNTITNQTWFLMWRDMDIFKSSIWRIKYFSNYFSRLKKKCGFATCNRLKLLNGATFVALSFIPGFQLLDENYIIYQEMHLVAPNCININFSRVNLIERRMCHWKIFASKVKYKTNSYLPGPANCHPRAELAEVVQSTLSEENFRQDCYQSSSSPASPEKQERHHRHQYFSRSSTWFHVIWTKLSNSIYDSLAL